MSATLAFILGGFLVLIVYFVVFCIKSGRKVKALESKLETLKRNQHTDFEKIEDKVQFLMKGMETLVGDLLESELIVPANITKEKRKKKNK